MKRCDYKGIEIIKDDEISKEEVKEYVKYLVNKYPRCRFKTIELSIDQEDKEMINIKYTMKNIPFERIRRITGYLVGTMDNWNDAKAAEERDRVKHDVNTEMEKI